MNEILSYPPMGGKKYIFNVDNYSSPNELFEDIKNSDVYVKGWVAPTLNVQVHSTEDKVRKCWRTGHKAEDFSPLIVVNPIGLTRLVFTFYVTYFNLCKTLVMMSNKYYNGIPTHVSTSDSGGTVTTRLFNIDSEQCKKYEYKTGKFEVLNIKTKTEYNLEYKFDKPFNEEGYHLVLNNYWTWVTGNYYNEIFSTGLTLYYE